MTSTTFLRIAAVITLLYCAGHTSGYPWTPGLGPDELAVIEAMKIHSFDVMGSVRTYWDFYVGFGIGISLLMLLLAVMLWQLASLATSDGARLRPVIAAIFVMFAANTVLTLKYFFIIPIVMSAAIAVCLALAFVTAKKGSAGR